MKTKTDTNDDPTLTPIHRRLLAKLPATAAALTRPECRQLRPLEQRGVIRYVNEVWVRVPTGSGE